MMLLEHTKKSNVVTPQTRRGSILVLVLGILAMMAVFAAVYLSIGIGDQRAARALERRQERQEFAPVVGDYIANVIGRDRMSTQWLAGSDDSGPVSQAYRETTDFPYVDYTRRSIPESSPPPYPVPFDLFRYNPEGTHFEAWPLALPGIPDPRVSDDGWLAASEPTYLGLPSEREDPNNPATWWRDRHDWPQISNLAPDGLFVNLFALRNNFNAERGIESNGQMNYWLSLIKRTTQVEPDGSRRLQATDANSGETHIAGVTLNPEEMRNTPYFWTVDQRNMFFPIGQGFTMLDPGGIPTGWGSPYFPDYQYADADGDGFADSRWFELKDSTFVNEELNLFPNTGQFRMFVAARVIDLSGRVNVNTASDGGVAPTTQVPLGATPAEIDVRRLLTMEDAALSYVSTVGVPLGYSSIPRPRDWGMPDVESAASDYSEYGYEFVDPDLNMPVASWVGWFAYDNLHRGLQVPSWPWTTVGPSVLPTEVRGVVQPSLASYDASVGLVPASPFEFAYLLRSQGEQLVDLNDLDRRALNRAERYDQVGSVSPLDIGGRAFGQDTLSERFGSRLFDLSDLSELLTYEGLNDPASFSRLESTLDGRYEDDNADPLFTTRRFGPLRSNRELAFERGGHDDTERGSEFEGPAGSDGIIDADALALRALSPRLRLTTISEAADLTSFSPLTGSNPNQYGVLLQDQEAKPFFNNVANNLSSAFSLYRRALAGYSNIDDAWDPEGTPNFDRYRTLFYGYGGPELAIRAAAHLAVNMKDQYDTNNDVTIATMVMSNPSGFPLFDTPGNPVPTDFDRRNWPGWVDGNRLTIPQAHAYQGGAGRIEADAVNVYGIEAQPFIVEAMSINVHTDAPRLPGIPNGDPNGDIDFNPALCQPPTPGDPIEITIGGRLDSSDFVAGDASLPWDLNIDFAMQVFAVKLHNPFNRPITLGAGASGPAETGAQADDAGPRNFDYYIEFGGRYFKLAQYTPPGAGAMATYGLSAVTLNPGETRVFYMLAQEDEQEIVDRWLRYIGINAYGEFGQDVTFADVQSWLNKQFELNKLNANANAVWVRRFDPETGLLENAVDSTTPDPDMSSVGDTFEDLWSFPSTRYPSVASGGVTREPDWRVVRLWKKFGPSDQDKTRETRWNGSLNETDNWIENDQLVDRLREPDPQPFTTPDGTHQSATNRVGKLDSRPRFEGGYDPADVRDPPRVGGTQGCEQTLDTTFGSEPNDNTGWTIALYSFVRRNGFADNWSARDPSDDERLKRGVLPIWCIEAISSKAQTSADTKSLNIAGDNLPTTDFSTGANGGFGDFSKPWAFKKFSQFLNATAPVEETFNQTPNEWDGPMAGADWPNDTADGVTRQNDQNRFHDLLYGPVSSPTVPSIRGSMNLIPELHVRSDRFEVDPGGSADPIDVSRVTDILTPLAIGPEYDPFGDPDQDGGADDDNDITLSGRYLTLSEAFALALGFDELDLDDANGDGLAEGDGTADEVVYNRYVYFDVTKRIRTDTPGGPPSGDWEYTFDRNQLWLTKFVPFVDSDMDGFFVPGNGDLRMGTGVTPAMALLDSVQTMTDGNVDTILSRAIPGRINVNTASLTTLRTIGMLSPGLGWDAFGVPENWVWRLGNQFGGVTSSAFDSQPYIDWAGNNDPAIGLGMPDLTRMDAAATIAAYRDRAKQIEYRLDSIPDSVNPAPFAGGDARWSTGFAASDGGLQSPYPPIGAANPFELLSLDNRKDDFGRQSITGIPGLREVSGFSSPGELLAARIRSNLDEVYQRSALPFDGREVAPSQLDYLARDTFQNNPIALKTFEQTGGAEFRVVTDTGGYTKFDPFSSGSYNANEAFYSDELGNDYDEQLVLQSQLMNLVTTRSDLFAVWFVVRGYTEADVSNLRGDVNDLNNAGADPMVPSLEKRYLMIVDRSKVGTWVDRDGDGFGAGTSTQDELDKPYEIVTQPEIVLLRELPR